jgi:hypothetical protein
LLMFARAPSGAGNTVAPAMRQPLERIDDPPAKRHRPP